MKSRLGFLAAAGVLLLLVIPCLTWAQASPLEGDLKNIYKPTRFGVSGGALVVTQEGTVLVVAKAGIRSFPPAQLVLQANKFQDGKLETPKENPFLGQNKFLPVDTRVYVMKVSVDAKKDKVTFIVVECDTCNGAQQPSYYKAQVVFQFAQGYLQSAESGQIADVVEQLLAHENGGGNGQGGQDAQGAQPPEQPAAAEPQKQPQTIEKGQTEDQVLAILGQPDKIVNLGAKKLYVYKDIKITFIGGKVADVQ